MIKVQHLAKSFGPVAVLKDVNAEISEGEVISLIGPSGAGKSTFLRCINLLDHPTGGNIIIKGKNILDKNADIFALRRKVGMVFQSFNLFSHLMAVENVMLGPVSLLNMPRQEAFDEGMKLLAQVGLEEKAYSYPDELSGGQKQRVAIARALAMHPEILLLDEPTSALDPTMVSEVLAVIRTLATRGMTMMIVTHEMRFARDVSTRVFYMDEGEIYEEGTPQQIFNNPVREKTRHFIHKIRTFSFTLRAGSFDLCALHGDIETFGRNQFIAHRQILTIQLVLEELLLFYLRERKEQDVNISVTVSYAEEKKEIAVNVECPGRPFDFSGHDGDLSMKIVRSLTHVARFSFENGRTSLSLILLLDSCG
ncbi:amino acid ABC transporter ATP-binding protein [Maridesulfovibrio sp. FT414]|uniref:amino acid ABC transporter ATP-binding protein n=1 Tax=Maridesulfovibrio sp. FT414 TaxID=2979469 RepID=UPI003D806A52